MYTKLRIVGWLALLALSTLNLHLSTCLAQGTAFTYQGRLQNNDSPASGTYNLTFSLFSTNTTGVAIAAPVTNNAVVVTNGLFTVTIDFGPGVFTGQTNWLQIGVETNGINTFTTLNPRQQLMPAPYAVYSEIAGNAAMATNVAGLGNASAITATMTNTAGSVFQTQTGNSNSYSGTFNGAGTISNAATAAVASNAAPGGNLVSYGIVITTNHVITTNFGVLIGSGCGMLVYNVYFYWNPTIGGYTNINGYGVITNSIDGFLEAGAAPLSQYTCDGCAGGDWANGVSFIDPSWSALNGTGNPPTFVYQTFTNSASITNKMVNADIASRATNMVVGVLLKKSWTNILFAFPEDSDAARGAAFDAAFNNAVSGDTIFCAPGNYYIARTGTNLGGYSVQYILSSNLTINFNGARFYHTATEQALWMFYANNNNNISLIGPGIIEGAGENSGGREVGVNLASCFKSAIVRLTFRHWGNTGLQLNNASIDNAGWKFPNEVIDGCMVEYNNIGCYIGSSHEYAFFTGCTFSHNKEAIQEWAGNIRFIGCDVLVNTNYGLELLNAANSGHGEWIGGNINHNKTNAVWIASNLANGWSFVGTHIYSTDVYLTDGTDNNLALGAGGLEFVGCSIDSPISVTRTNALSSLVNFKDCYMPGTYTTLSTNIGPSDLAWIKFRPTCTTPAGQFGLDEPWTGNGSGLTFTNGNGARFKIGVNTTTNGLTFIPQ